MTMRFGLIGCGGIGTLRAAAFKELPSARLVAVSDVDRARAEALAGAHGARVVPDWRALVEAGDVDAVIVSTPPFLHAGMTIAALEEGKHVLCEKPIALTPAEARAMVDAAEATGRLLATGFNYRFYPSILKARELLGGGMIGELDHIRSYAGYSATDHNPEWVHDIDVVGGGALRDNGIHLIDLTRYFLGEVAEVRGMASDRVWGFRGCEDNGFALLRGENGAVASLQASWTEWAGYRFLVEVYGTLGCIRAWCFPMKTQVVWSAERGGAARRRTYRFPMTMLREHMGSYRRLVVDSFVHEFDAFVRAARGEATALATGRDGLRALEIAALAEADVEGAAGAGEAVDAMARGRPAD